MSDLKFNFSSTFSTFTPSSSAARAMAIPIKISLATDPGRATGTRITPISRRRTSHQRPARQHHACCWSMKCICAIRWPKEWTRSPTAYTHSKLFYHKVWKIWVISKLPDRPMSVNWCFILFASVFKFFSRVSKKISCTNRINEKKKKLFVALRRIGWKPAGISAVSLSDQTT